MAGNASRSLATAGTKKRKRKDKKNKESENYIAELIATIEPGCKVVEWCDLRITQDWEVEKLCRALVENTSELEEFKIDRCEAFGTEIACQALSRVVQASSSSLHTLELSRVGMEVGGLARITAALSSPPGCALVVLVLGRNQRLGDAGVKLLVDYLSTSQAKYLKVLWICGIGMGQEGSACLAEALLANSTLDVLAFGESLATCGANIVSTLLQLLIPSPPTTSASTSAAAAADGTAHYPMTQIRIVESNEEPGLARTVARVLASNNSLRTLGLFRVKLNSGEWRSIFRSLHSNTSLQTLDLRRCKGLEDVCEELEELVKVRRTPLTVYLTGTALEGDIKAAVMHEALRHQRNSRRLFLLRHSQHFADTGDPSSVVAAMAAWIPEELAYRGSASSFHFDFNGDGQQQSELLPSGLKRLLQQLSRDCPTSSRPPLTSIHYGMLWDNIPDMGDYFHYTVDPWSKSSAWWRVRWQVLRLISEHPGLEDIDLSYCGISRESEVQLLCQGLHKNQVLKILLLNGNHGFGTEFGCQALRQVLQGCSRLSLIRLDDVGMGAPGLAFITQTFIASGAMGGTSALPLEGLTLEQNQQLGEDEGAELLAELLSHPQASSNLKLLSIIDTGLGKPGAARLSAALRKNSKLENLRVGEKSRVQGGNLRVGAKSRVQGGGPLDWLLTPLFTKCPSVDMDDDGSVTPPQPNNGCSLKELSICKAKEDGLGSLISRIVRESPLPQLTLQNMSLAVADWQAVFNALKDSGLIALSLNGCTGLHEEAYEDLERLIYTRQLPLELSLEDTRIGNSGSKGALLIEALKRAPKSRLLFLQNHGTGGDLDQPMMVRRLANLILHMDEHHDSIPVELDTTQLSHQVQVLLDQLQADPPTMKKLPLLANEEEFGDYFTTSNQLWNKNRLAVRLKVFSLLGYCTSLTTVNLVNCGITSELEIDAFCRGLLAKPVLQVLDLGDNTGFGTEYGCQQLALVLQQCNGLRHLSLSGIGLEARGLRQIQSALCANYTNMPQLDYLDVSYNPKLDGEAVASFLGTSAGEKLVALEMLRVGLTIQGAAQLSKAIVRKRWPALEWLSIGMEMKWTKRESSNDEDGPLTTLLRPLVSIWKDAHSTDIDGILWTRIRERGLLQELHLPCLSVLRGQEEGLGIVVGDAIRANYLKEMELDGCQFSEDQWRHIFRSLGSEHQQPVLENLSLSECDNLEHVFEDLVTAVKVSTSLQQIDLRGTWLERNGKNAQVFEALRVSKEYKSSLNSALTPSEHSTSYAMDEGAIDNHLPEGLQQLIRKLNGKLAPSPTEVSGLANNVEQFGLYFTPFSNDKDRMDVRLRVFRLISSCPTLITVDLDDCGIIMDTEVETLCAGLRCNTKLETLSLSSNPGFGGEHGCLQVGNIIRNSRTLRDLDLSCQGMTCKGLQHILDALRDNDVSALGTLNIAGNRLLGDLAVRQMANLLRSGATVLNGLYIDDIGMSADSVQDLAEALMHTKSLDELGIGGQNCATSGPINSLLKDYLIPQAITIGNGTEVLSSSLGLTNLYLNVGFDGQFGEMGVAQSIADLLKLKQNPLEKIRLSQNEFSTSEWRNIFSSLHSGSSKLKALDLCYSKGLEYVTHELQELLEVNIGLEEVLVEGTALESSGGDALVRQALIRNTKRRAYLSVLKERFNEAEPNAGRLFLCGPSHAGKTTLWKTMEFCLKTLLRHKKKFWLDEHPSSLVHNILTQLQEMSMGDDSPTRVLDSTCGMEIHTLEYGNDLQVSVWDLGGQDEFHVLHQCLFPNTQHPCFFVFVFDVVDKMTGNLKSLLDLKEKLLYWLRFISSNSRGVPRAIVILTHFDELHELHPEVSKGDVLAWAHQTISSLQKDFETNIKLLDDVHVLGLRGGSYLDGIPILLHQIFDSFRTMLQSLGKVPEACNEASNILVQKFITHEKVQPFVSVQGFKEICLQSTQLHKDHMKKGAMSEEILDGIIDYMHDIGQIIFLKKLGCIVIDPQWFGNHFVGKLMSKDNYEYLSSVSQDGACVPRITLERFLVDKCLGKDRSTGAFFTSIVPRTPGAFLIQVMQDMYLCYKVVDQVNEGGATGAHVPLAMLPDLPHDSFFLPNLLKLQDPSGAASIGERRVEWPTNTDQKQFTFFGRRLQCQDPRVTFLTPGLFTMFQVGFRTFPNENAPEKVMYKCESYLVSWCQNGFEVLVECSKDSDTYVDILVRCCDKAHMETLVFVKKLVTDLRDFWAANRPKVELNEAILRPKCVEARSLFVHRKGQAVLVEDLKKKLLDYLYNENQGIPADMVSIDHVTWTWQENVDKAGLSSSHEDIISLLGAKEAYEVLKEFYSKVPGLHPISLEAFTRSKLRDMGLNSGEGLKKALLTCFTHRSSYPNDNVRQGGRRGLALIISMEKGREPGGQKDTSLLQSIAETSGFELKPLVDKTAADIRTELIKILSDTENLEKDDGFLCCISAHGGTDGAGHYIHSPEEHEDDEDCGPDCQIHLLEDILKPVRVCPQLRNKPKVFIVNACRGVWCKDEPCEAAYVDQEGGPIQEGADCLLVFSTTSGFKSYRGAEGSIFVRLLEKEILANHKTRDVETMITSVRRAVNDKCWQDPTGAVHKEPAGKKEYWQGPVSYSSLQKQVFWD